LTPSVQVQPSRQALAEIQVDCRFGCARHRLCTNPALAVSVRLNVSDGGKEELMGEVHLLIPAIVVAVVCPSFPLVHRIAD
jgi:hypothetical protein